MQPVEGVRMKDIKAGAEFSAALSGKDIFVLMVNKILLFGLYGRKLWGCILKQFYLKQCIAVWKHSHRPQKGKMNHEV